MPTVINKSLIFKYSSQFTDSLTSGLSKGFARRAAFIYSFDIAQDSVVTKSTVVVDVNTAALCCFQGLRSQRQDHRSSFTCREGKEIYLNQAY